MSPTDSNKENSLTRNGCFICCCMLVGLPATAYSQQWNFEPVVRLTAQYNDNTQLTTDDSAIIDSTAFTVDANGRFVRRGQSSEVRIAPRIRSKIYTDNVFEDTNDYFFDFFAAKNLERSSYGLQARYAQEDVLTAELDDPDFDNPDVNRPVDLDTGRVRVGTNRESIIFSPYFNHEWTETIGFLVNADYVDVSYDQNQLNLTDYTNATLGTGISYKTSNRSTWSLIVFGDDYEAISGANRSQSQTIGAGLELRHEFSPTMDGKIAVGYQEVDSDVTSGGVTVSESNGGTVYSAGITKKGDVSRVVLDASRTVDPGGTGFLQDRTQFRLRYTRQLSPKMFGDFNARIQNTKEISPAPIVSIERNYQRYGAGLEWRISRIWSVRGDYRYTEQDFDQTVGSASSNEFGISLIYDPARRAR